MNYLDTLKVSNRERYSRKLQCLYGKSETDKENSCQELDPYYTMTTTLFAHQNGGRSSVNWINVRTTTGLYMYSFVCGGMFVWVGVCGCGWVCVGVGGWVGGWVWVGVLDMCMVCVYSRSQTQTTPARIACSMSRGEGGSGDMTGGNPDLWNVDSSFIRGIISVIL